MAGKRQHIIPRFLLKGFAISDSDKKKDKPKIWVYSKQKDSPFRSTDENIAVEKGFYTHGNDEADTVITTHEGKWAKLVRGLRAGDTSALLSPDIPDLLWHLEIRSKTFREEIKLAAQKMTPIIFDWIHYGDLAEHVTEDIYNRYIADIEMIVSQVGIQQVARKLGLTDTQIDKISSAKDLLLFFADNYISALRKSEAWWLETINLESLLLRSIIPQASRAGHIQGLFKTHNELSGNHVSFYKDLEYEVHHFEDNSVILGDSVIMRLTKDGKYDKRLTSIDKMMAVALPLSFNQVLVGHAAEAKVDIDMPTFREAVAGNSKNFFVGAFESDENKKLHKIIGTKPSLISDDELSAITKEILP